MKENNIQRVILQLLQKDLSVFFSWGAYDFETLPPNGLKFTVNGFLYKGGVFIIYDKEKSLQAKEFVFAVKIGNSIYNNIKASELADFIDKKIEYSEKYEQMLQQEYTTDEIEFYKHIEQVIII